MGIEEKIERLESGQKELNNKIVELEAKLSQQQEQKMLSVKQAAAILHLTPNGVNHHIRAGKLKATGRRCKKITEAELLRFQKENGY